MEFAAGDVWHLDNVYDAKPTEISAYLQDKMEFAGMIVNVGVRFDGFKIGRAHVWTPVTGESRMPSSAWKKKKI